MDWFQIDWKKHISLKNAKDKITARDHGIYTFYEVEKQSPKKILYIGETYTQTFKQRIKQHEKEWLFRYSDVNIAVGFGIIHPPKGRKISQDIVFDCEGILIYHTIPPCNTTGKKRYTGRDILVVNTGSYKLLSPIVTTEKDLLILLQKYIP